MALEAVVFPYGKDLFVQTNREENPTMNGTGGLPCCAHDQLVPAGFCEMGADQEMPAGEGGVTGIYAQEMPMLGSWDHPRASSLLDNFEQRDVNSSPEAYTDENNGSEQPVAAGVVGRRKRRRARPSKNKEEVENQRMTHIAVERNRRKQMNEYLALLRSLMPPSYVQRGDQASIIGGAINFVRELEQLLQSLEAQKRMKQLAGASAQGRSGGGGGRGSIGGFGASPFAHIFTFPQYSTSSSSSNIFSQGEAVSESRSAIADIEVTIVESHANLKVLSRRRPKQLRKMVVGLQSLRLTTLHLDVTTIEEMVLYSFSLKAEDDCLLSSVDEIAAAVYRMLEEIQEAEMK